jgi:drug/metabolite transporter (DMT)-like permease
MGVTFALIAMVSFASNILITRYALARMPVESGFLLVLGTNILFPAAICGVELAVRTDALVWDWKGFGLFAASGILGTFLGRRMLFDAVRLLGPSRTSVFHSSAPAFAFLGAWLLAGERLGLYEIALVILVWCGLWLTHPPAGSQAGATRLTPELLRRGMGVGLLAVAGFGFGNVVRGIAVRGWNEAVLGTVIASGAAFALQLAVTRDWTKVAAQLRAGGRGAILLYVACGVATALGSIFVTLAMAHIEIGLAVLVVHTTPLVIFPVSVFLLKQKEQLSGRTLAGTALVLAGVCALMMR